MTALLAAIVAAAVIILGLLVFSLCRVAGRADESAERSDRGGHVRLVREERD